jgi:hydroxymethylbilane synthase
VYLGDAARESRRDSPGNVNTRLDKLRRGDFDAIVLAAAGLARLGKADIISQHFAPADMLPAAAQGVVGVECLEVRTELRQLLEQFDDPQARVTTVAERAVARALDASCHSPVASYATLDGDRVSLQALVAAVDGSAIIREAGQAAFAGADALGTRIAGELLDRGAGKLLRQ